MGDIRTANCLIFSLKVAENKRSWTDGFCLRMVLIRRTAVAQETGKHRSSGKGTPCEAVACSPTPSGGLPFGMLGTPESSAKASALSISSASSKTKIVMRSTSSTRFVTQFLSFPWVPITTCAQHVGVANEANHIMVVDAADANRAPPWESLAAAVRRGLAEKHGDRLHTSHPHPSCERHLVANGIAAGAIVAGSAGGGDARVLAHLLKHLQSACPEDGRGG